MNPIFYYSLSSMCFICVIIIHGSINIRGGIKYKSFPEIQDDNCCFSFHTVTLWVLLKK